MEEQGNNNNNKNTHNIFVLLLNTCNSLSYTHTCMDGVLIYIQNSETCNII